MACLDENQVVALAQGRLDGEALQEAQEHLDQCLECLDLVGMFQQSSPEQTTTQEEAVVPLTETLQINLNAPPGSTIGRYEVIRAIGRGGMGVVYLARDPTLDRNVALKLVRPSLHEDERAEHFEQRLMREARAMAKLSHPNVLTIYDVGLHGEQVFLASEWIDGSTLEQWMARGSHSWRSIVTRFTDAARGLAAAHKAGLVHRDFKPANVMIGPDERIYVFDFGLVKSLRPSAVEITTQLSGEFVVGTPAYMAPEQMVGDLADERADQFSFCVALFEALAARRPFVGRNVTTLLKNIGAGKVDFPTNIPRWLSDLLRQGMRRVPAQRHESMSAVADFLASGIRKSYRRPLFIGAGVGAAAVAVAALGYWGGRPAGLGVDPKKIPAGVTRSKPSGKPSPPRPDKRLEALRLDLERLRSMLEKAEYREVSRLASRLASASKSNRAAETRLWNFVAMAKTGLHRYQEAADAFEKSFYAAVAGSDDERAALAAARAYEIYALKLRDRQRASQWYGLAESTVERSESIAAKGLWARIEGDVAQEAGRLQDACAKYSESLALLRDLQPEQPKRGVTSLERMSRCEQRARSESPGGGTAD